MALRNPFASSGGRTFDHEDFITEAGRTVFLERSFVTRLVGQTHQGVGMETHLHSSASGIESWMVAGQANGTALATGNPAINTFIAVPFVAGSSLSWDRIAFEVTTVSGANGKARVGVYSAKEGSDGLYYPGTLVVQSAQADVSSGTGSEATTISYQPVEGALYFAAYLCGTANPTIRTVPVGGAYPALGLPAALGTAAQLAYTVASTFSTTGLPTSFPAGATAHTTAIPAIFLRYAAPFSDSVRSYVSRHFYDDGYALCRSFAISSEAYGQDRTNAFFTIEAILRERDEVTVLGTYDSRTNRLSPGVPFVLTGEEDVDTVLSAGATLEVRVTQRGRPLADLSPIHVQWDCAYVGETNDA